MEKDIKAAEMQMKGDDGPNSGSRKPNRVCIALGNTAVRSQAAKRPNASLYWAFASTSIAMIQYEDRKKRTSRGGPRRTLQLCCATIAR